MSSNKHSVPGSERAPLPGARAVGAADPNERIEVTVVLRRAADAAPARQAASARSLQERKYLTREELESAQGAAEQDIARVEAFAQEHGLDVVEANRARRSMVLSGTVADLSAAFGVTLTRYEHPSGTYRGRTGGVQIPVELGPIVQAVLGLDDRPQSSPKFRIHEPAEQAREVTRQAAAARSVRPFSFAWMALLYSNLAGTVTSHCYTFVTPPYFLSCSCYMATLHSVSE